MSRTSDRSEWVVRRYRGQFAAVRYIDGRRERRQIGEDVGAAKLAVDRLNKLDQPDPGTVAEIWEAYAKEKAGKPTTNNMRSMFKPLQKRFFHLSPEMITIDHCRDHTAERRAAGLSDGTIHTELGYLRIILNWAVKRKHITEAPYIERPPKPAPRDHYLTRDQVNQLIAAATLPHVRLYLILLITTSARIGAILDLTWDRVDMERQRIMLKNPEDTARRKGRATIPINRSAMAALQEARTGALTDYVIEWAGEPVKSIKKSMATVAKRAGLKASAHVLRHSAAVWMSEALVPEQKIANFLGHTNVEMIRRVYGKYRPDHLVDAAEVLELDLVQAVAD